MTLTGSQPRSTIEPRALGGATVLVALFALAGCDSGPTAATDAYVRPDVTLLDVGPADAGTPCTSADDCDDGIACTLDTCVEGFCFRAIDNASCDDGVFCNGAEVCDPTSGCTDVGHETCDDSDVCTIDRCVEATKLCEHAPRDLDADGDPDFFCTGSDCDDFDPTRNGLVAEVCSDGVDDDCDGTIDESTCGRPRYDVCDDPLVVTASGTFAIDVAGAAVDYATSCASGLQHDLVVAVVIPEGEPQDLRVEAQGDTFTTSASLRTACTSQASETSCRSGYPATVRARALEPGTYYVIVGAYGGPGTIAVDVELSEATTAPTNETCGTAMPIEVPTGGTFSGSFVGVADDGVVDCGFGGQPDLAYTFTIPDELGPQNVNVTLASRTGDAMTFALRDGCPGSVEPRCSYGSPASGTAFQLDPGTYVLTIEGPSSTEVDYDLTVRFASPTAPPAGDVCESAIPVTLGTTYSGTLLGAQDDVQVSCGFHAPDAFHTFHLDEASDVTIALDGGTSYVDVALATECPPSSTLRCDAGAPARGRVRNLPPGDYVVVVEGTRAGTYGLSVAATSPPTEPVAVSGNDNCATAYVVPETGGLYTGNTTALLSDYMPSTCGASVAARDAVFELTLTSRRRVVAATSGSAFDTVLYYYGGSCSGSEWACDDDGGGSGSSYLDRTLEPGTYYFVVDAFSSTGAGDYTLEVLVQEPS